MRRLRALMGRGMDHDGAKWANRARNQPWRCERVIGDVEFSVKAGKPIRKTLMHYTEDAWGRFR
jgi:hypothetical protein